MHETVGLVLTQLRMVWRFRWLALVVAIVLCVAGWSAVVLMPNQYKVEAKVFLDTSSMLRPLLRGLAIDNRSQENSTLMMRRTLLVRPNLESVARKTDMDLKAKTPEDFEALLNSLAKNIAVSGTRQDNIFVIGYKNSDPELATKVVEAILNLFVERSLGDSRKDAGKTKQFLERQIAEYESRLTAAENRLKDFKQNNVGLMPGEGGNYFARLEAVRGQLADAKLQLEESTRRRDEYRRQLEGVDSLFETDIETTVQGVAGPHPLDARIEGMQARLDQLLLQYTEKHPDVTSSRALLDSLLKERDESPVAIPESVARQEQTGTTALEQELSVALGQAEADVAGLDARVQEFDRRVQELQNLVDTVPRIEAELSRLNRDYEINKRNYDELVKRRESLALSEQASQSSENVQFNIIEPPRVPLIPTGPNRPLFSGMVLALGLGLGVGLAWLIAYARPAVYRREDIELAFNLPVIGTVSRSWTRGEVFRRRMEVSTFFIGCMLLGGLFSGLLMLEGEHNSVLDSVRGGELSGKVGAFFARYL
ncbi:MAG: polysaccharide chain length determinant protein (PEP-CTERM system associated) [Gammaproteobacteria bacterium]|jgi:polysaccharide chain length determinant protein (PEP-CTERM system associated)